MEPDVLIGSPGNHGEFRLPPQQRLGARGAIQRESVPVQPHHKPPGAWPRHPQAVHHLGHSVKDLPRPLPVAPQFFQKYVMVEILIGRFHRSQLKPESEVAGRQLSQCFYL